MYSWQNVSSPLQIFSSRRCFHAIQMRFNFMKYHFSIVFFNYWTNKVIFRKSLDIHIYFRALLKFSLSIFRVLGLTLRSWIHLKLIFVQGENCGSNFILLPMNILFPQYHLLKMLFFSSNSGGIFVIFANLPTMSGKCKCVSYTKMIFCSAVEKMKYSDLRMKPESILRMRSDKCPWFSVIWGIIRYVYIIWRSCRN